MASITAPNSLQIRLAFSPSNSTKFPILLHSRFPHFDRRRIRLFCVANNENGSDNVLIRVGSDGSPNSEVKKNKSNNGGETEGDSLILSSFYYCLFSIKVNDSKLTLLIIKLCLPLLFLLD